MALSHIDYDRLYDCFVIKCSFLPAIPTNANQFQSNLSSPEIHLRPLLSAIDAGRLRAKQKATIILLSVKTARSAMDPCNIEESQAGCKDTKLSQQFLA